MQRIEQVEENAPTWLKKCFATNKPVYIFTSAKVPDSFRADLQNITDYLYVVANNYISEKLKKPYPRINLGNLKDRPEHRSFTAALEQAKKWHDRIASEAAKKQISEEGKVALAEGTEFIMNLGNGFSVVRLLTAESLDKESDYMGHCVGKGGYDRGIISGSIRIYSIRDAKGEPHATIEVKNSDIIQCKGKGNKPVVKVLNCSLCTSLVSLGKLPSGLKELNCMAVRIWSRLTEFLRPSKRLPLTMELNIFRITFRIIK